MAFIDRLLQPPSYGWKNENNSLVVPGSRILVTQAFQRLNILTSRKNWQSFLTIVMLICLLPFVVLFFTHYFSFWLVGVIAVYSTVIMGVHGTVWFHRYCTHQAYQFSHPIWRVIVQHLVVKTLPEEIYVLSHHVHHAKSDQPGDPYNARGGFLYCMLAEFNHQRIAPDLDQADYNKASRLMRHTGVSLNSYSRYQRWGSVGTPAYTIASWLINWVLWAAILIAIGGPALMCAVFSAALLWFVFVRAFNYTGHGKGKDKHIHGVDFDRRNLSINQTRPGLLTGEWHNNHHLFPGSARAGFLKYQLDPAWMIIYSMYRLGMVRSYHDSRPEFLQKFRNEIK